MKKTSGNTELFLSADCFCKGVFVDFDDFDVKLSDNFFDITSKRPVRIIAYTEKDMKKLFENIKIKTV